jgi:hypothetical protein
MTTTKSGVRCSASTKHTTGSHSVVTQIVFQGFSSLCFTSATLITSTTWAGGYSTTYYTTGTDSTVPEVVEVPHKSLASSSHGTAISISSAVPISHTTTFTNTNDVTQTGLVSVFASVNSYGSPFYTSTEFFHEIEKTLNMSLL